MRFFCEYKITKNFGGMQKKCYFCMKFCKINVLQTLITTNMNYNYYQVKVTYSKDEGDGKIKSTKETFLAFARNYADAESRTTEKVASYSFDGLPQTDISKVRFAEVFTSDDPQAGIFYKAKVILTTQVGDGDHVKEKKVAYFYLVQAHSIKSALQNLERGLQGTISDYSIHTIAETPILDYYNFAVADVRPEEPAAPTAE